jgi:hypothetical protein
MDASSRRKDGVDPRILVNKDVTACFNFTSYISSDDCEMVKEKGREFKKSQ